MLCWGGGGGLCTMYCSRVHPRPPRARTFPPLDRCCWTCEKDADGKTNHKNSNNDTTHTTRTAITKSTRCARCSRSCAVPRPPTPVRAPGAGPDHAHEWGGGERAAAAGIYSAAGGKIFSALRVRLSGVRALCLTVRAPSLMFHGPLGL